MPDTVRSLLKKRLQDRCFSVNLATILKTSAAFVTGSFGAQFDVVHSKLIIRAGKHGLNTSNKIGFSILSRKSYRKKLTIWKEIFFVNEHYYRFDVHLKATIYHSLCIIIGPWSSTVFVEIGFLQHLGMIRIIRVW